MGSGKDKGRGRRFVDVLFRSAKYQQPLLFIWLSSVGRKLTTSVLHVTIRGKAEITIYYKQNNFTLTTAPNKSKQLPLNPAFNKVFIS